MQEETEIRQRKIENRQEGTESRQQENVDTKSHSKAIIDSFTELTTAWKCLEEQHLPLKVLC